MIFDVVDSFLFFTGKSFVSLMRLRRIVDKLGAVMFCDNSIIFDAIQQELAVQYLYRGQVHHQHEDDNSGNACYHCFLSVLLQLWEVRGSGGRPLIHSSTWRRRTSVAVGSSAF
jgi:hypothetical protein